MVLLGKRNRNQQKNHWTKRSRSKCKILKKTTFTTKVLEKINRNQNVFAWFRFVFAAKEHRHPKSIRKSIIREKSKAGQLWIFQTSGICVGFDLIVDAHMNFWKFRFHCVPKNIKTNGIYVGFEFVHIGMNIL